MNAINGAISSLNRRPHLLHLQCNMASRGCQRTQFRHLSIRVGDGVPGVVVVHIRLTSLRLSLFQEKLLCLSMPEDFETGQIFSKSLSSPSIAVSGRQITIELPQSCYLQQRLNCKQCYLSLVIFQLVSLYIRGQKFSFKARHTFLVLFQLGLCLTGSFQSGTVKVPLTIQLLGQVLKLDP